LVANPGFSWHHLLRRTPVQHNKYRHSEGKSKALCVVLPVAIWRNREINFANRSGDCHGFAGTQKLSVKPRNDEYRWYCRKVRRKKSFIAAIQFG
jgi:hypothetical protein